MHFEKRSLQFENVLTYEVRQLRTEWQEGIMILEDFTLPNEIYQNGPVFFSVAPEEGEKKYGSFTYYLPINEEVEVAEDPNFGFEHHFKMGEAIALRQADQEVNFHKAYDKVKQYAKENNIPIMDTYYVLLLEVYGEYIIDLYVPLKKRGDLHGI